jgi:hypothetical protein
MNAILRADAHHHVLSGAERAAVFGGTAARAHGLAPT